ncbi:hypothetical protein [Parachlamydia sp. AcF125]|uniref:hypothetical protein n=1 Tax=Parachlamydia sp. AcF125 TaxID=2795736 RepID=UPI001BC9715E|nr:hypothetical protein [Parachlamydia sp. AcF125]
MPSPLNGGLISQKQAKQKGFYRENRRQKSEAWMILSEESIYLIFKHGSKVRAVNLEIFY